MLDSGRLMSWGPAWFGQLGNGEQGFDAASNVPVPVCAAYTSGTCPSGPYLDEEGSITALSTGGFHDLVAISETDGQQPTATTEAATNLKPTSATLNATVNPEGSETSYYFEYGETEAYGSKTEAKSAGSGTSDLTKSESISGLKTATTYHFRVVATGAGTVKGKDKTFTTEEYPPTFSFAFGKEGSKDGQLSHPQGIAIDSAGNIWVTDSGNSRIEKFNSKGEYLSKFGTQGSGDGQLEWPTAIAIDSSGNIWVTDSGNSRIEKFNSKGEYLSKKFGTQGSGDGQLEWPTAIAIDSAGNILIADEGNNRIEKFNSKGEYLAKFGTWGEGDGQLAGPTDIAIDTSGNLLVADWGNNRIEKFNSSGEYLAQFREGSGNLLYAPSGIAIDATGDIWVASQSGYVEKLDPSGNHLASFGEYGTGEVELTTPSGIATDSAGNIWVLDEEAEGADHVQKWVTKPPKATTEAATEVKATSATLNATINPEGTASGYYFEYGETTSYGSKTPAKSAGSGTSGIAKSDGLTDLKADTTYHFRVVATGVGRVSGEDKTFTTLKP
jgi:streptogramin lyase